MAYTTQSKVEQYTNYDLSAISSEVANWILSAVAFIEKYCGKTFESAAETRYFDGNAKDRILIDAFTGVPSAVTILEVDGTTQQELTEGAANDYVAYPLNDTEKNELVLLPEAVVQAFRSGRRRLLVTANFGGSSSVPADIELVATKLVARIADRRMKGGQSKAEKLGDYSISFKDLDEETDPLGIYAVLDLHRDIEI